jgi:hypothetical protein
MSFIDATVGNTGNAFARIAKRSANVRYSYRISTIKIYMAM